LHEVLVGSKLVWARELASLISGDIEVGDAGLGGIPAFLQDSPVSFLVGQLLREPPLGDLVQQRVAWY